jgi:hypothetical protein
MQSLLPFKEQLMKFRWKSSLQGFIGISLALLPGFQKGRDIKAS